MIQINIGLCKDCKYCMKFCPKQILETGTQRNGRGHFYPVITDSEKCISCGICAVMCPEGAIELPAKGDE